MTLAAARRFLLRNDKAQAMATGRWHAIREQWNAAWQVVQEAPNLDLKVMRPVSEDFTHSEESKAHLRLKMREVALLRNGRVA